MNKQQLAQREQERAAHEKRMADFGTMPLNCAAGFWPTYRSRPGMARRHSLVALFERFPRSKLPVNSKWQANTVDPDLQYLLKRGVLVQVRSHPGFRNSSKRQTYLVLASQAEAL